MTGIIYLDQDEDLPDFSDDDRWLSIEASSDGQFFAAGASWESHGHWVGYGSLIEDDISLERALAAAQAWATKYAVPTIWVQVTPYVRQRP